MVLCLPSETLPKEFKYLGILFTSAGKRECEIGCEAEKNYYFYP